MRETEARGRDTAVAVMDRQGGRVGLLGSSPSISTLQLPDCQESCCQEASCRQTRWMADSCSAPLYRVFFCLTLIEGQVNHGRYVCVVGTLSLEKPWSRQAEVVGSRAGPSIYLLAGRP